VAQLTITAANPLDHAAEIKQLFVAEARPEFPPFFDRAYAAAARAGALSWLGRDGAGRLVMHVACFPRRFTFGAREIVGGLMVNAMVARAHRSVLPALALVRRAAEDARRLGLADFLYADPNESGAAVASAAGFVPVGALRRYVLPIADRRAPVDAALRLRGAWSRLAHPRSPGAVVERPAAQFCATCFEVPWGDSPRLRPHHDRALYAARMAGYPGDSDRWFAVHPRGDALPPAAALLVRGPESGGLAALHAVRRDPRLLLPAVMPPLAAALRRSGCTQLQVCAVAGSALAAELRAAGFVGRHESSPILAAALTPAGEAVVRSPRAWEVTQLECDR
jgi:hypothetical protein